MEFKKYVNEIKDKLENIKLSNNRVKIYWCKSGRNNKNFGDLITSYIYTKITGKKPIWWTNKNTLDPVYFGSGSIMKLCKGWNNVIIWGSGIIHSEDTFDKPNKILCVRGPLTRKRFLDLGYDCPEIYGDIGILLPEFYSAKKIHEFKIGIIPHFVDFDVCKKLFSNYESVLVIDVCNDVETVVDEICKCDMTMCSSLHGIIVSHAYGIKSCWIKFSDMIVGDNIKYLDYYYSINLYNVKKPIFIGTEFLSKHSNVQDLIDIIDNYPNPKFPLNIKNLVKTIPF